MICSTLLLLTTVASAQTVDDPWGAGSTTESESEEPKEEPKEEAKEEAKTEASPEEPKTEASPEEAKEEPNNSDNVLESEQDDESEEEAESEQATTEPLAENPKATPEPKGPTSGHGMEGLRVKSLQTGSGVSVRQSTVLGRDGGTNQTMIRTRYAMQSWTLDVGVPFSAYRVPGARTTDIGNLQFGGWRLFEDGNVVHGLGLTAHINMGERAYSWVNSATELWPGTGADLEWQMEKDDGVHWMARAALGLHSAAAYDPFPELFLRFEAAAALDFALSDSLGMITEASFAYWDTSPFELNLITRWDPAPGLRVRTGFVLPIFVWANWMPPNRPPGLSESTWLLELSIAL